MKTTAMIILFCALFVCVAVLFVLEKKNRSSARRLVLIALLSAMSVIGRFAFAPFAGFKPVAAIVIIAGVYVGFDAGIYVGMLSALITNCYFGQGPWTLFQMLSWGIIGALAGVLGRFFRKSKILMYIYGALCGILFSMLMDIYTVIWTFGFFSFKGYFLVVLSAIPYMIIYAVSNVIFLVIIDAMLGKKLENALVTGN